MMSDERTPRNDLALAEAALFLSPHPVSRRALAKILGGVALSYVDQLLEDLQQEYLDPKRGVELHMQDGRGLLRVKAAYVNDVAHLAPQQDIPRPILRTLAVIAYNHPMTQADLIKVRGNKGYGHVQELLERRLILAEDHGRTLLLSVTKEFLRHFGLTSVDEFRFHFAAEATPGEAVDATPTTQAEESHEFSEASVEG
ncbi:MAG TPA: SMC-Scp complex subunit ScpB, partial [Candidatus Acetothermia bacterium]|nr:SMC-Scp complex subunit ScpB [Candidatus Acetothermia bacterium]